jgi:hypothetical protein
LIDSEKWMIKTHKENYWSSWIMKSQGNPSWVGYVF